MTTTQIAAQHTAGPWECSHKPVGPFWHISSANTVSGPCKSGMQAVASVHAANKKHNPEYATMFAANARLIAAAPDLLAALQELTVEFRAAVEQMFEPQYHKFIETSTALKQARAAIEKATACPYNYGHPHDFSLTKGGECCYCGYSEE